MKALKPGERSIMIPFQADSETARRLAIMTRQGARSAFLRKLVNRAWETYQAGQENQDQEEGTDGHRA